MTPEETKSFYMKYASSHLKFSLDDIVPSSSSSFKNHLYKIVINYIEKHSEHHIQNSFLSDNQENQDPGNLLNISELNNILKNSIRMAERLSDTYIQHKQLFKQAFHKEGADGFRPLETKTPEDLSDGFERIIYRNKVKKYANSFLRSYKNLMNEDTFRLFGRIYDGDYDRNYVQKQIRKIASFKDSDDLNNALTKIIESEHSVDYVKHQIEDENLNAEIIYSDKDQIYVDVKDFKASQVLGSSQWCISTQEDFFKDYIYGASLALFEPEAEENLFNAKKGNQIFCFNFSLEPSDPEFAIGLTISNNGTLYAAHNNDDADIIEDIFDDEYNVDPVIFTYIKNIKKHDPVKIINDLDDLSIVYEDNYLSLNYRNPLNILIKLEDKFENNNGFYSFEGRSQNIDFNFTIIRKSLDDLRQYEDISNSEMLHDLIKAYPILKKINSIKEEKHNDLFFDEFSGQNCVQNHQFWECTEINNFIENLDSIEININYRKNKEIIDDIFNDFDIKSIKSENTAISEPGHFIKNIDNKFIKTMLPFVIENDNLTKETTARLAFLYMIDKTHKDNETISEYFRNLVKNGDIHINKILSPDNWKHFSSEIKKDIVNLMNHEHHIIKNITPKDMETLLTDKTFSELDNNAVKRVYSAYSSESKDKISIEDCVDIISSQSKNETSINENLLLTKNKRHKKLKA